MSARTYMAPSSSAATASPSSTDRLELTATLAPARASSRAVSAPIPLEEPVINATLPARSAAISEASNPFLLAGGAGYPAGTFRPCDLPVLQLRSPAQRV